MSAIVTVREFCDLEYIEDYEHVRQCVSRWKLPKLGVRICSVSQRKSNFYDRDAIKDVLSQVADNRAKIAPRITPAFTDATTEQFDLIEFYAEKERQYAGMIVTGMRAYG